MSQPSLHDATEPAPGLSRVGGSVAVVIPCHNYGRFLEEAYESVRAQTQVPDQIVIVNDGSSDETCEVAARIASRDPRVSVIERYPARGAINSFNDGIRSTAAEYVMLLSADDLMNETYIESSAAALDGGYDVALTAVRLFGNENGFVPVRPWDLGSLLLRNDHHGSMMYRRSVFDAVGGYGDFRREDWAMWIAAAALGARGGPALGAELSYRRHGPSRDSISVGSARADRLRIFWHYRRLIGLNRLAGALPRLVIGKFRA
jgi:glycosyltransferase involved in cell wall biosynthesis